MWCLNRLQWIPFFVKVKWEACYNIHKCSVVIIDRDHGWEARVRAKMWLLSSSTPVCTEANTSTVTPAHLMLHMIRYFFPLCIGMLGLNPCKALVTFALQHPPLHSSGQNWAMVRIFSIQIESLSICQTNDCPLATTWLPTLWVWGAKLETCVCTILFPSCSAKSSSGN